MPYHDDAEAVQWLQDYWDYVQMIEHGNEPSLDEIGGWDGLAQAFMDDDVFNQTVQYISDDIESDDINSDAGQLLERLKGLKERYGSMSKMKKMSFTERVCQYIKNNYDIPDKMEFYIGTDGYDFEDWVDAYIEEYNNNVSSPFDDNADESDVEAVGEEILQIMTAPYKTGNEYVINYDDFEASTKKMKKSIYDDNDWDNDEFYGDNNQRQRLLEYVKRTGTYKGSVPDGRGERQFYDMPDGYTVQFVIDSVLDAVTDVWRTNDFSEWDFPEIQKSQDIHSMIADIRKNNNSLKKSRVDLRFE